MGQNKYQDGVGKKRFRKKAKGELVEVSRRR